MADARRDTNEPAIGAEAFFSPDRDELSGQAPKRRLTWPRLLLRIALCVAFLVAVDGAVARTLTPASTYERHYRLPRTLPTASLADFAASIHAATIGGGDKQAVAFLGASPTWGHRIKDPASTFPAAFEAAGNRAGWLNRTYNLASNGQFLADEYFIAKAIADDVDVVYVQLTYHTFNPKTRGKSVMRYSEIPRLLDVDISPDEATLLGVKPSASGSVSRVDRVVSKRWLLWRERDALDRRLFGGKPRQVLADRFISSRSVLTSLPADSNPFETLGSLDDMPPTQRMIAISRFAENSSYKLAPNDSEVVFLRKLVKLLEARNKKAVFFMSPLNREVVEDYELVDPKEYSANLAILKRVVSEGGFPLVDPNTGPFKIPSKYFADISHTTDQGGRIFGEQLFRETAQYLGAGTP